MVKCLNIRKNIGKTIYQSISSRDTQSKLQIITVCICGIVLHHQHFQNHQVQQWADCFRWSCDESRFGFKKLVKPRLHWCVSGLFDSMKRPGRGVVFQESLTVCYWVTRNTDPRVNSGQERERVCWADYMHKHKRLVLAEAKTSSVSISMRMCRDGWVCVCSGFTRNHTNTSFLYRSQFSWKTLSWDSHDAAYLKNLYGHICIIQGFL